MCECDRVGATTNQDAINMVSDSFAAWPLQQVHKLLCGVNLFDLGIPLFFQISRRKGETGLRTSHSRRHKSIVWSYLSVNLFALPLQSISYQIPITFL